jgi:hypothetical protein
VDDAANRYARELVEAINAAVANDPAVQACRARARAAGVELNLSLEAVVGISDRATAGTTPAVVPGSRRQPQRPPGMTAADRRFLRSLRIAAEEETEAK